MIYSNCLVYIVKHKNEKVGLLCVRVRSVFWEWPVCVTSEQRQVRNRDTCCDKAGGAHPSSLWEEITASPFPCLRTRDISKRCC